ncbi:hypothetical protein [Acinetobacter sp.]|uniref:hypothetical protein n=1 Tax=Acinetobacter sp. TaxID=472 RepID=UPI0025C45762|nr:hypothetical protein [Acinetobacter sp.]
MWYNLFLILAITLYLSGVEIAIKPFSISFSTPLNGIGSFLVFVGVFLILYEIKNKSYMQGARDTVDLFIESDAITEEGIVKCNEYVRRDEEK